MQDRLTKKVKRKEVSWLDTKRHTVNVTPALNNTNFSRADIVTEAPRTSTSSTE